jgi:hypothetical protein
MFFGVAAPELLTRHLRNAGFFELRKKTKKPTKINFVSFRVFWFVNLWFRWDFYLVDKPLTLNYFAVFSCCRSRIAHLWREFKEHQSDVKVRISKRLSH